MALDFLILYEHVVREYESILLLKAELARRGYTVELRQLLDRKKLKYFTLKKPKVTTTRPSTATCTTTSACATKW